LPTFDNTSNKNKTIRIGCLMALTLAIRCRLSECHFNTRG
jgi:hypothetical protein